MINSQAKRTINQSGPLRTCELDARWNRSQRSELLCLRGFGQSHAPLCCAHEQSPANWPGSDARHSPEPECTIKAWFRVFNLFLFSVKMSQACQVKTHIYHLDWVHDEDARTLLHQKRSTKTVLPEDHVGRQDTLRSKEHIEIAPELVMFAVISRIGYYTNHSVFKVLIQKANRLH